GVGFAVPGVRQPDAFRGRVVGGRAGFHPELFRAHRDEVAGIAGTAGVVFEMGEVRNDQRYCRGGTHDFEDVTDRVRYGVGTEAHDIDQSVAQSLCEPADGFDMTSLVWQEVRSEISDRTGALHLPWAAWGAHCHIFESFSDLAINLLAGHNSFCRPFELGFRQLF